VLSGLEKIDRGRPTVKESVIIDKRCRDAFNEGLSILQAVDRYGLAKDTVWKHFRALRQEVIEDAGINFIEEHKIYKYQAVMALERNINKIEQIIHSTSDHHNDESPSWHNSTLSAIKIKSDMEQEKFGILMQPTLDITGDRLVELSRVTEKVIMKNEK
jgi:hypothetical protein